jgi:hypothetical protein
MKPIPDIIAEIRKKATDFLGDSKIQCNCQNCEDQRSLLAVADAYEALESKRIALMQSLEEANYLLERANKELAEARDLIHSEDGYIASQDHLRAELWESRSEQLRQNDVILSQAKELDGLRGSCPP